MICVCVKVIRVICPRCMYNILRQCLYFLHRYFYNCEVRRRKKFDIFQYKLLAKDMKLVTKEYGYNAFYGLADIVKKVEKLDKEKPIDASIEHGIKTLSTLIPSELKKERIYAFGRARQKMLMEKFPDKDIRCLRPYIQYVTATYPEDVIKERKHQMGKTLLVFPGHSTHHSQTHYEFGQLIMEIENIKKKYRFQNILVCLYWKDILLGRDQYFTRNNYQICTAGHIYDPLFLNRLRSIILLSDMTMGNNVGTHLGYSVTLGRPYYLFWQKEQITNFDTGQEEFDIDLDDQNQFIKRAIALFGVYRESIDKAQKEFVKDFWGDY